MKSLLVMPGGFICPWLWVLCILAVSLTACTETLPPSGSVCVFVLLATTSQPSKVCGMRDCIFVPSSSSYYIALKIIENKNIFALGTKITIV